jgi:hypothetical protein
MRNIAMKKYTALLIIMFMLGETSSVLARTLKVDCDKGKSLMHALKQAEPGDIIHASGLCQEAVMITEDGLTLEGHGNAVIEGGEGVNAVTVDGAQQVTIRGFEVRNGRLGILGKGGVSFALHKTAVRDNANSGIRIEGHSSLALTDCVIENNGFNGMEVDQVSNVNISGNFLSQKNALFGVILGNNSSITFAKANARVQENTLGIQIGINSSGFIADSATTVTASNNLTTGLTVVAGSTLFAFEGAIIAEGNQLNHGVSANSNSNIDLDRGGSITAKNNGQDGIQLEDSLLNLFNMPGLPASQVKASGNGRHGLSAFLGSKIDLSGDSMLSSQNNGDAGLLADNGSAIRIINSNITGNSRDVVLSFGARAELSGNSIGAISCDDSVLIRGDASCP